VVEAARQGQRIVDPFLSGRFLDPFLAESFIMRSRFRLDAGNPIDGDGEAALSGPILCQPCNVEREARVPVQMELKRIIISEVHDQQVIMLKEVEGDRSFPIVIGIFEATSIDRRVKGMPSPRPLTHDLVASVIDNMGGELQDIFISELRDHTYFAKLRIRLNAELVEVDSRPSDAIALAVTAKVPIYVAEDVLGEVCGE
jgi:bifunctional DNase/RNase